MKHKTIHNVSAKLLADLNSKSKDYFTIKEAGRILPESSHDALKRLLSNMVKRGLLLRIKDGVYNIVPYEKDIATYQPNWHLTAKHLVPGADFYIGYYSALEIHGLITQPSLKEQIVINKIFNKNILKVLDITFQLIYHNKQHFFGAKETWIDNYNKVKCSDLEKTFIDCFFKPGYAGGIVEIAKAFYVSREKLDYKKLYNYSKKFGSQAVIKRMGFIMELLEINNPILKLLQKNKTKAFTLLDTELPLQGKMISSWSIQQNIDTETIKSSLTT